LKWGPLGREKAALLAVAAFAILYLFQLFNATISLRDDGIQALGAWRISRGEMPYSDFFEIIPPLSMIPTALLFKIFGPSILAWRAAAIVLGLLLLLVFDSLLRLYRAGTLERCAGMLFVGVFGLPFWPTPSHHWYADVFLLASLALLAGGLSAPRPFGFALAAGAATAFTCFSLQDQGGYLTLLLCILFFPWVSDPTRRRFLWTGWCVGGLAVGGAMALWLLPHVSPAELWNQWVAFPSSHYRGLPGNTLGIWGGWEVVRALWGGGGGSLPYSLSLSLVICFMFALPFVASGSLLESALRRRMSFAETGLLAAGAIATLGCCLHRWSLTNLDWAAPPLLAASLVCLSRVPMKDSSGKRLARGLVLWTLLASSAVYGVILFRDARRTNSRGVLTPAGTVRSIAPATEQEIRSLVSAVERLVPRDAPLFCRGFSPMVNFLTLHPNPTRFNLFFHPGYHTDEQAREVVRTLTARGDVFVLVEGDVLPGTPLEDYLLTHYTRIWVEGSHMLLRPLALGPPPPAPLPKHGSAPSPPVRF